MSKWIEGPSNLTPRRLSQPVVVITISRMLQFVAETIALARSTIVSRLFRHIRPANNKRITPLVQTSGTVMRLAQGATHLNNTPLYTVADHHKFTL